MVGPLEGTPRSLHVLGGRVGDLVAATIVLALVCLAVAHVAVVAVMQRSANVTHPRSADPLREKTWQRREIVRRTPLPRGCGNGHWCCVRYCCCCCCSCSHGTTTLRNPVGAAYLRQRLQLTTTMSHRVVASPIASPAAMEGARRLDGAPPWCRTTGGCAVGGNYYCVRPCCCCCHGSRCSRTAPMVPSFGGEEDKANYCV